MVLLAELPESSATGRLGEIYADIRRLGGVPMVALIFRHLATRPGMLEWAWDAIGPAWQVGMMQEAAWRIAREAKLEPIAPLPRDDDIAGIREVLEAYNRANPENMLSMLCLLRLLDGNRASVRVPARAWPPPPSPGLPLPMIDVTAMDPAISNLLDLVSAPGAPGSPRVIQSLYRHLAQRPAFFAVAVTRLRQRFDDGSIGRATDQVAAGMNAAADGIVRSLDAPRVPDPAVREVLERFSGAVIPQMIVVGRLLEEALPKG